MDFTTPDVVTVYYSIKEIFTESNPQVNVVIAGFVTTYARLELLNELEKIGERVLYYDTDSIIYVSNGIGYDPKLGDYLGQLTNEIDKKDGNYIVEFLSCGPKNYAYQLDSGKQKCTIKGFTLNYQATLLLNFESMKQIIFEDQKRKIQIEQLKFARDKKTWDISTSVITKLYSFVYDKRVIQPNMDTLPFGY